MIAGSVTIEVVKGRSMPNMDVGSLSDCYVILKWLPKDAHADSKESAGSSLLIDYYYYYYYFQGLFTNTPD